MEAFFFSRGEEELWSSCGDEGVEMKVVMEMIGGDGGGMPHVRRVYTLTGIQRQGAEIESRSQRHRHTVSAAPRA